MKGMMGMPAESASAKVRRITFWSIVVSILVVVLVAGLHWRITSLNREWKSYAQQDLQLRENLRSVRKAAGYGGFIHHFKNYVLRREPEYYDQAGRDLETIGSILDAMASSPLLMDQQEDIAAVNNTFSKYHEKWREAGNDQVLALSAEEFDLIVKQDDYSALAGLESLDRYINHRSNLSIEHLNNEAQQLLWLSYLGLVLIPVLLAFGFLLRKANNHLYWVGQRLVEEKNISDRASQAKSEFLANMSHEIRNPLNAVLGVAHLLNHTELDAEQKQFVKMIETSGKALLTTLDDILDFSKIEAGRLDISSSDFNLEDVMNTLATIMSSSVEGKDVELLIRVGHKVPERLRGDALRVQQILINLASNAIKFTEKGVVAVGVKKLDKNDGNIWLRFSVADTGMGISEEQKSKLFQPFSQADSSITRSHGGTGLGLVICRRLVSLMHGEIGLNSELGEGSEFWFALPFAVPSKDEIKADVQRMKKLNVLVVDDHESARKTISDIVSSLGWMPKNAASGYEALKKIRAAQEQGIHFDLVLIDWKMPSLSGLQVSALIRREPKYEKVPIVILATAQAHSEIMKSSLFACVDAILVKPVTASGLYDTAVEVLIEIESENLLRSHPMKLAADDPSIRLDGVTLLVVEDNCINQEIARRSLERTGALIEIASNGREAVEQLRQFPAKYNLVLMDVQMPEMDGYTACKIIRKDLGLTLPILAMTAGVMESEKEQCLASGMDDLIAKPFDFESMVMKIAHYCRQPAIS